MGQQIFPLVEKQNELKQMTLDKIQKREVKLKLMQDKLGEDHTRCKFLALQVEKLKKKAEYLMGYQL
jgi:hypothetical protein